MLDSNQRPPPCKGGLVVSQMFVIVQISLQTDLFSLLNCCCRSPLFVWVGVKLVSTTVGIITGFSHVYMICSPFTGAGRIRTCDPRIRSPQRWVRRGSL